MTKRGIRLIATVLALGILAGVVAPRVWQWLTAPPPGYCSVCRRIEHKDSLVKFKAEGEAIKEVCCPSCALNYGRQTAKAVTIVSVTDHDTGREIDPTRATFVVGSDVSPCTHAMSHVGPEKESFSVRWDRCLPSILAFASADAAEAFRGKYGGRLRSLQELLKKAATTSEPLG
jgi:hypothetical protein